jgi:hypothetical protein
LKLWWSLVAGAVVEVTMLLLVHEVSVVAALVA